MGKLITFDDTYTKNIVSDDELQQLQPAISNIHKELHSVQSPGDLLGWVDLPKNYDREEFNHLEQIAAHIRAHADVLLVIGVGGSYLGANAVISALTPAFSSAVNNGDPDVYFLGHHFGSDYTAELLEALEGKSVYVNVISKSGTTAEPAIAFRIVRAWMMHVYGKQESAKRIIVTTDREKGALNALASEQGFEKFVVPNDIGGRYSVLTPVGLLPIAVAGISGRELLEGAAWAQESYGEKHLENNAAYHYAALRFVLYQKGKQIELLSSYEPKLTQFAEWWKQLFGESEGKNRKGLFPAAVHYTTDLHSIGQYVQDGRRHLFGTALHVKKAKREITIPQDEENVDGLNYLAGETLQEINHKAFQGALLAHTDGEVPNVVIGLECLTARSLGALIYFFEKACAMSGCLLGVNPFDQPGVESYKRNMFALLGKAGFGEARHALEMRLSPKGPLK